MTNNLKNKYFLLFIMALVVFSIIALFAFDHSVISGDAISYIDAMEIISGSPAPIDLTAKEFAVHRILTTFLGLDVIIILSLILGKITTAWLLFDSLLYFGINIIFYFLIRKIFKSDKTSLICGLLFASNYAMITAGIGYFMDIGGWFFYILSIYFLYSYVESGSKRELLISALAITAGAFFKENALVAFLPFASILLFENYLSPLIFLKKILPYSLAIFIPITIHHIDVFIIFHRGYLYWVNLNQEVYHYSSRIVEYIKSFGSLLNFLIPISLLGLLYFIKMLRLKLDLGIDWNHKKTVFLSSVLASSIPAIMWPGITQRVLFMVVPGLIIFGGFLIKKYEKYWYLFIIPVIFYALSNFFMDSFILNFVNLPF